MASPNAMPSPSTMAEPECNGRVRMQWPSPNAMAESEYNGRVILEWPSPTGCPNPSGLAESDWLSESEWSGRVTLAESEDAWPSPNGLASLTGCPNVLAESSWPSELRPSGMAESEWSGESDWLSECAGRIILAE